MRVKGDQMYKTLGTFIVLSILLYISGCGADTDEADTPIKFMWANPPSYSTISPSGNIILTFDSIPANLSVTPGIIEAREGRRVTIAGPFSPGPLEMRITWTDGMLDLRYYVISPCADEDTECF